MLGIDVRAARVTWTVLLIAGVLTLAWLARGAIFVVILALLFAYLIAPVVAWAERFAPRRMRRGVLIAIIYVIFFGIVGSVATTVFSRIASQAAELAGKLPDLLRGSAQSFTDSLPQWLAPLREYIDELSNRYLSGSGQYLLPLLKSVGGGLAGGISSLLYVVIVPILSFMLLVDGKQMRKNIVEAAPSEAVRLRLEAILDDLDRLLGNYMRAMFLFATTTFTVYSVVLSLIGVPYALLLAGIGALAEFLPVVGPLAAVICGVGVAMFAGYPHWVGLIIFYGLYRLFLDYVIQPLLMSAGVEIHPILVLFGALAGEQIAGIPGMLLSVPAMAALRILWRYSK